MKSKRGAAALVLLGLLAPFPAAAEGAGLQWTGGLRVRQEILPNVYYFDGNENDRNWIRYRTRAGLRCRPWEEHTFEIRLVNEFRKIVEPDTDVDYDEVVIDRLSWAWRRGGETPLTLTLGRQDIIWNDGFLMLEGHPFDGSRTMYQNALRLQVESARGYWEAALMVNPKRDPWVVAGDEERALSEADEKAIALRFRERRGFEIALIGKGEDDPDGAAPDRTVWTAALRRERPAAGRPLFFTELALQRQAWGGESDYAFAYQLALRRHLPWRIRADAGFFYYSGDESMGGFRAPFGGWPKWSDLYIYTLIGEEGVAAWRNISAPHAGVSRPIGSRVGARVHGYYFLAPEPDWEDRGVLTVSSLTFRFLPGWTGHLLWEWLRAGSYPEGQEADAHFLRWQLNYDIP